MYEPLQLTQAFRNFGDAASPWGQHEEGVDYVPTVSLFSSSPPPFFFLELNEVEIVHTDREKFDWGCYG